MAESSEISREVKGELTSPVPVPTHGPGGTFSVKVSTHIQAPPSLLLATIRDTTTWPKWNTFCPSAKISGGKPSSSGPGILDIGTAATIKVFMNGDGLKPEKKGASRDQGIEVTFVDESFNFPSTSTSNENGGTAEGNRTGARIAWKSTGYSHWQLHSERVMEFIDDGKGGTEYVCWETFGGVLGMVVRATVGGQLVERFRDYAGDLRGFVEKGEGA